VEGNPWRCHSIKVESIPISPYKGYRDAVQFSWCIHKSGFIDKGGVPKAKQAVSAAKKALRLSKLRSECGRLLVLSVSHPWSFLGHGCTTAIHPPTEKKKNTSPLSYLLIKLLLPPPHPHHTLTKD